MKKFLVLLAVLVLSMSGIQSASAAKVNWRLVTHAMPGTEQQHIAEVFCETVKTLSKGEFVIEPFAGGVLFPVFESFDAIANGVVDAGLVYSAYWTGKDPLFTLTTQPGNPLGTFAEAAYFADKLEPWFAKLYAKHRITYLGHAVISPIREQFMSVVPINTLEDLKGKKVRTAGFGARFYEALGATTISLAAPEIYTAFQTKNIDAAEWTFWDENLRMGFHEVAKYVIDPAIHTGAHENWPLLVNPGRWDSLSQENKDILLAARDVMRYHAAMLYVLEVKARQRWREVPGITIKSWSPEDEVKASDVGNALVIEECNKSAEGKEFLDIYRSTLWELGYKDQAKKLGYTE
ncbi:MAG TPA: hypothetical protein DIC53_09620 [Synergistaceae bacterium]|nr:hypothetical protein [Synergistaceae bacterium]